MKNKNIILVIVLIGSFVALLNQTLLTTALPQVMASLNVSLATGQWLTTSYMLINGIMIPVTAYFINSIPTKKLYLGSMGIFILGTLIAAISGSFWILMAGRFFQAVGSGITMALGQVVILSLFPIEKRGAAMGLYGLVLGTAPAIGPTLAGIIIQYFRWQMLFYLVLPILIIDFLLGMKFLEDVTEITNPSLDKLSVVLSTISFGSLLYGFSNFKGNNLFAISFIAPLVIGVIALIVFVQRQRKLADPLLDFSVLNNSTFLKASLLSVVVTISMVGTETMIPILMQNTLGFSALQTGFVLLPGAVVLGIMMPISGRLFDKYGIKWLAIVGFALILFTSGLFMVITNYHSTIILALIYMVRMLGISLVMMPLVTVGMNQIAKKLFAHGTAVINTFRQVGGAIGTAILITLMSNNQASSYPLQSFNHAFIFATIVSVIGMIISISMIKKEK